MGKVLGPKLALLVAAACLLAACGPKEATMPKGQMPPPGGPPAQEKHPPGLGEKANDPRFK